MSEPSRKCDLVMKGGITSGVVYPSAVHELSREFQFVNIGGTSAGAIAAALTAAAEYRRQHDGSDEGFEELETLPEELAEKSGGRARLLSLFQPSADTKPFFEAGVRWMETQGSIGDRVVATFRAVLGHFHDYAARVALFGIAAITIVVIAAMSLWRSAHSGQALALALVALLIAAVTTLLAAIAAFVEVVLVALRVLPINGFGICSGMGGRTGPTALTEWLTEKINHVAGLPAGAPPLTLGQLSERSINLQMMTTNLTHGRPYTLPFDNRIFSFLPREFEALFPKSVVDFMVANTHGGPMLRGEQLYAFPEADNLPVVVSARLSLSFPVLLSAVSLYAIDYGHDGGSQGPEKCWFSDGGITSNFPVHLFDSPLPRWPTFAINLAEKTPRYHKADQRIYLPKDNNGGIGEWWNIFGDLKSFLWSIVKTMQSWRDNMLLRMPGYRDRIAHVLLTSQEGGLNLSMDKDAILDIAKRGREAASVLRQRFGGTPPAGEKLTWANHTWVRFLSYMPALEPILENLITAVVDKTASPTIEDFLAGAVPLPSYQLTPHTLAHIDKVIRDFRADVAKDFAGQPFGSIVSAPKPNPIIRAGPRM